MIKVYDFEYISAWDATVSFEVDTDVFTPEMANITLEFFTWDYDEDNDPIDEVMKKYAMEVIKQATFNNYSESGVINAFNNNEGFGCIDGSIGIKLIEITPYEFDESELTMSVKTTTLEEKNND